MTEAKNVNVSYNFDLRTHVFEKRSNGLLGVICKVLNKKTLSGERFCFFEKRLLSALSPYYFLKKIMCFEYVIVFVFLFVFNFLQADDRPTTNFLGPRLQ